MFVFATRESLAQICDAAAFSVLAVLALIMVDAVVVFGALDLLAFVSPADFVNFRNPTPFVIIMLSYRDSVFQISRKNPCYCIGD